MRDEKCGSNRRTFLKRAGGGALSLGLTYQTVSTLPTVGASASNPYWEVGQAADSEVIHSGGAVYEYKGQMASSLRYVSTYVDPNTGDTVHKFSVQNECVSRKEAYDDGDWKDYAGFDYTEIEWNQTSGGSDFTLYTNPEGKASKIGARPEARSNFTVPNYPDTVEYAVQESLAHLWPPFNYALTAYDIANALVNDIKGNNGDGVDSNNGFRYKWPYGTRYDDASNYCYFLLESLNGQAGSYITGGWSYWAPNSEWLNNSWEIYYDGSSGAGGATQTETQGASMMGGGNMFDQRRGRPPEGDGWHYFGRPDNPREERVPIKSLPEDSPAHRIATGDEVIQTQAPFYVRSVDQTRSTPPERP